MKTLIILALTLSLNAGELCEIAKADYDNNIKEFTKGRHMLFNCRMMVIDLMTIRDHCDYSLRTQKVITHMIATQKDKCDNLTKGK